MRTYTEADREKLRFWLHEGTLNTQQCETYHWNGSGWELVSWTRISETEVEDDQGQRVSV